MLWSTRNFLEDRWVINAPNEGPLSAASVEPDQREARTGSFDSLRGKGKSRFTRLPSTGVNGRRTSKTPVNFGWRGEERESNNYIDAPPIPSLRLLPCSLPPLCSPPKREALRPAISEAVMYVLAAVVGVIQTLQLVEGGKRNHHQGRIRRGPARYRDGLLESRVPAHTQISARCYYLAPGSITSQRAASGNSVGSASGSTATGGTARGAAETRHAALPATEAPSEAGRRHREGRLSLSKTGQIVP